MGSRIFGLQEFFRRELVGDEHVDEAALQTGADRLDLAFAAGDADDARRFFQFLERYGDDPIVERPMHRRTVAIEELQGNVADCALFCEILQLSLCESVAGIGEHDRRLERSYSDESDRHPAELVHRGAHVDVAEHHEARR